MLLLQKMGGYVFSDWHTNACLNFQGDMSHGYVYGYKKSADILVKKIKKTASEQDYLVYPIIFLYRHHIELLLKNLIQLGIEFYEESNDVPKHHRIKDLWNTVKGYHREFTNSKNAKNIQFIDKIMDELCEIDADSMSFRYSKDRKGIAPNPELLNINLEVFSDVICQVSDELETFEFSIRAELELKWDGLQASL
jgi:hypothetical protein